jgi:hypothetical protein
VDEEVDEGPDEGEEAGDDWEFCWTWPKIATPKIKAAIQRFIRNMGWNYNHLLWATAAIAKNEYYSLQIPSTGFRLSTVGFSSHFAVPARILFTARPQASSLSEYGD